MVGAMIVHLRIDEAQKSDKQKDQRELCYYACKLLRKAGYNASVTENYTGRSLDAHAASIHLDLDNPTLRRVDR